MKVRRYRMQYKYTVLTNTTVGAFMALLDSNIVLISLPTIVRELPGTSAFEGIWVIMGYSLVSATLLLSFGRLADLYGRVRLYKMGFALFTVSSGLCSIAPTGSFLVVSRLLQGTGAALIWSNNAAIITDAFPPTERGRALGINQVAGVSGSVSGLVAGGILTGTLGWRSIFWINLPIGTFATLWAHTKLKELGTISKGERPDPLGNAVFAGGLSLFLLGITLGAITGWSLLVDLFAIVGLLLLGVFPLVERRRVNPMMDLGLFRIRAFSAGITSNFLAAIARGTVSLIFVFYFQGALLLGPFQAGLLLLPFSVAFVCSGPFSGFLSDKYGSRFLSSAGLVVSAMAYLWFATLPVGVPYSVLVIPMVLAGIGGGMFVAPNTNSIMSSVPVTRRGVASGTSATLFNTGFLLSLSISFVVIAESMPLDVMRAIFSGTPVQAGELNLQAFSIAMKRIFSLTTVMALAAVVPSLMRGRRNVVA
jgi:EmrB/QacA subfamily drug resistance transporter